MASASGAGGRGGSPRRTPQKLTFEEIVPSSGWTENPDSDCLLIDLPGFKLNDVKLQVDNYGHLVVSGEKQVNDMRHVRFQQSYQVPDNSNIEDTTAKFEDGILYIFIPRKATAAIEVIQKDYAIIGSPADHPQKGNKQNAMDKDEAPDAANKIGNDNRTEKGIDEEDKERGEEFHDAKMENHWDEGSLLRTLRVQLIKNKGILVTAVLAFSLGVLVSQKMQTFQTSPEQNISY